MLGFGMKQDRTVSVKVSSAAGMNVGRLNIGVLPSSKETRVPLKSVSMQTKMTAGNCHQSFSSVTSVSSVRSC